MVLRVFRWSPGSEESTQDYPVTPLEGMTVLDALVEIQRGSDATLAFRYACRVGMCGSCAMVIAGRERWACRTLLARLPRGTVTVRPLYHFPLLRDLVVDLAPHAVRLRDAHGAFTPRADAAPYASVAGDSRERAAIDPAIECIGCGMCVSACTLVASNPRFPGPAALNRALTLQLDSRDGAHGARWEVLLGDDALARCHGQGNCTAVCPMGLEPTASVIRLRRLGLSQLLGTTG